MVVTGYTYTDVLNAIAAYYGSGSDQWLKFATHNIDAKEAVDILSQVPGVNIIKNTDGTLRSYTYEATANATKTIASEINSNVASTAIKTNIPAEMGVTETGKLTLKSGLKSVGNFITKEVAPALVATACGISLGKTFDKALYNVNPDFWDSHGMSSLNPDTWSNITSGDDSFLASVFNAVFQIDSETNTSQMYIDENALAYMAYYMQTKGVFDVGQSQIISGQTVDKKTFTGNIYKKSTTYKKEFSYFSDRLFTDFMWHVGEQNGMTYGLYKTKPQPFPTIYYLHIPTSIYGVETNSTIITAQADNYNSDITAGFNINTGNFSVGTSNDNLSTYTYNNKTVYYKIRLDAPVSEGITPFVPYSEFDENVFDFAKIAWLMVYGESIDKSAIDGVGTQDGATVPDLSTATSIEDTLAILKALYPQMWENAVEQDVVQPDGSVTTYVYVPVATPEATSADDTQPTSGNATQADPVVNPDTSTETLLALVTELISRPPTPTDTNTDSETGNGETPSIILPAGSASALFKIYNPTQTQLDNFGAWLWSSSFVDQIAKLFNDPMQAIIGLHKVYCPVPVAGLTEIKVGYLNSGVPSNYIDSQYVTVDCGSVSLNEFFGNVFDYEPFTKVSIYLPFVGVQQLSVGDIMRSTISVVYRCDVLTGACLAEISIKRDGVGGVLYTFTGNMAVQYPVSSGSYIGLITGGLSVAGAVAGVVASGGAFAPVAVAAHSLAQTHTDVAHSGSFSGNAGAMGIKKPYLIITRPQSALAESFPHNNGYPTNYTTTLGDCSGYIEVDSVHVENIPATKEELGMIEQILKEGILI